MISLCCVGFSKYRGRTAEELAEEKGDEIVDLIDRATEIEEKFAAAAAKDHHCVNAGQNLQHEFDGFKFVKSQHSTRNLPNRFGKF